MRYAAKVASWYILLMVLASPIRFALAAPPPIVALSARVTDFSGELSADALSYLSSTIEEEEKPGVPKVRVVVIGSSAPEPIDSYAERLLAAQPATAGVDVLLVVEPAAKTARIAVSAAARSRLSPIAARVILRESVFGYLTERGADGGTFSAIEQGARRIGKALQGEPVEGATTPVTTRPASTAGGAGLAGIPPYATVTDLTGALAAPDVAGLTADIDALKARKGAQVAILMLASTKPESIEQYALRAFEQWQPGRKGIDDGVLIVVAKDDRRLRIEVGYGLEGTLTDAVASRIINEQITPRFKQGDFAGGLMSGLERIKHVIDGEPLAPLADSSGEMPDTTDLAIAAAIVVLALVARFWLPWYLCVLFAAAGTGGILWFLNGLGATALFLGCFAGAITFMLPPAVLGLGRSSSGHGGGSSSSGRGGSDSGSSSDGGGGSSGGGGASGSW